MVKIPYGESNFKALIDEGYYYVDKTMYLEKLERVADTITYLRPRRFGKSLFTSLLFNYYDIKSKDNFEKLFKNMETIYNIIYKINLLYFRLMEERLNQNY